MKKQQVPSMHMRFFTLLLFTGQITGLFAADTWDFQSTLQWYAVQRKAPGKNVQETIWTFKEAQYGEAGSTLPHLVLTVPIEGAGRLQVTTLSAQFESFDGPAAFPSNTLTPDLEFRTEILRERNAHIGKVAFVPLVQRGGRTERLVAFQLHVSWQALPEGITPRSDPHTTQSVLSDGQVYKFSIDKDGVYKLDYNFLKNELKIDVDRLDPRNLQLFGNGGDMLPEAIAAQRPDDLTENAITIIGENDGKFDAGDYILFYGDGPDVWGYKASPSEFTMTKNIYSGLSYYFLKIGSQKGLRVTDSGPPTGTADYSTDTFDDYIRLEEDKVNLMHDWLQAQGSGRKWYGDAFRGIRKQDYNNVFNFPNAVLEEPMRLRAELVGRSTSSISTFRVTADANALLSTTIGIVDGNNEDDYARMGSVSETFTAKGDKLNVSVEYPATGSGEGWLDYVQINARRRLIMSGSQMQFRDSRSIGHPAAQYRLSGADNNILVWDITNAQRPSLPNGDRNGNVFTFVADAGELIRQFIAFNQTTGLLTPKAVGAVSPQNLHGIEKADMLIVYHPDFEEPAKRLAQHRRDYSQLEVMTASVDQIYNEFASGSPDPTAIRDFAKMLYDRSPSFRFLLLLGDGSFDNRNLYKLGNNFIPTYQTESLNPIFAFPSDDYFALLSDNEGEGLRGALDIGIGRLPVSSPEEAAAVIEKIIHYDTSPETFSDWRNNALFVGDDEDNSLHTRDADDAAELVKKMSPVVNVEKVFLDAFPQVATSAGQGFPLAEQAINQAIFKGTAVVTYLGHGGSSGWAHERVLDQDDINSWTNYDKLCLFVTATCQFAGYDDPGFVTAGELVLLNPKGGAVALFTTVRAVYASLNALLTDASLEQLYQRVDGQYLPLGEVLRRGKNKVSTGTNTNSRKYTLLGDPAQVLALPRYQIKTTNINTQDVSDPSACPNGACLTLKALQKVTIEGAVTDADGNILNNFDGLIYPSVFDKTVQYKTLGQDPDSRVISFNLQRNVIFKGKASVSGGKFTFTFVVPKDINYYTEGLGKISYYAATAQGSDAGGAFSAFAISGTDANAPQDNIGPQIDVYMNNTDFAFGGITSEDPVLLVQLSDDNGINVAGNSIGHDLEAVLDDDTENTFLLNTFYEAALDDYTKGEVRFPLFDLAEGRHKVQVKAWDAANNSSDGITEFVVATSEDVALKHVLNYPNPFTDQTCFQFEHNLAGVELDVQVQIFTVSGLLVKTLQERIIPAGFRLGQQDCIPWNGRDDYGDPLGRGVYLYKIKVRAVGSAELALSGESNFEKLVILK